jgi:Uma2 family endonuclease
MIAASTPMTPEQLLAMPDSKGLEIVRGKLVEIKVGAESSQLAMDIVAILAHYLRSHPIGRLYGPDTSFQCFPHDPTMVRKPDVAFLSYAKWPANKKIGPYIKVAPELAIEVLSPNDVVKEVYEKVEDYLKAGVSVVWVVNEFGRFVEIHKPDETPRIAGLKDTLTCEDILPGFRCEVREIFARLPTED